MEALVQIEAQDRLLLAKVQAAMDKAVRRGGKWIACKPGCTGCCKGPFAITMTDAARLRRGMAALRATDPQQAEAIQAKAQVYVERIQRWRTGDYVDVDWLPEDLTEVPCPALDVATGLCELYESRPMTCRLFGPATRVGDGPVGACELCFVDAEDEEIESCAVDVGFTEEDPTGGTTVVAVALVG